MSPVSYTHLDVYKRQALKHRIFFMKGDNRRIPGWMQMHYRMAFDEEGYPQLYVFTGCRAFRRTVPGLLFLSLIHI